jgi:regulator of replication initiation timing
VRSLERQLAEAEAQLHAQDEAIADLKSENVALRENNINVKELFDGKCLGIAQAWAEIREKDEAIATLRALVETWRRVANGHYYGRDERHGMLRCADELEAAIPGQPDTSPKARRE